MRTRLKNDLLVINILSILLIIIIAFLPSNVLRIILGLPFVLFFPGYTLIAALFPRKADLGGIERVALSFGLSIAVTPLIGLILNYTPWGIRLYPILVSLVLFILVASAVASYRRRRLSEEERFSVALNINFPQWASIGRWDKVLSVVLLASILGAIGTLAYVVIAPKVGEKFTEFYILGLGGKAENYPKELAVGEEGKVIVGIVNHEHQGVIYRVEILIDGEANNEIRPIELAHDQKWEDVTGFIPQETGESQKVEFLLYKQGDGEPYRSLYLWLDVKGTS